MRGVEPLPPAWKAVVLAVEHHTRRVPLEAGSTPGWNRTNDLPRIRRVLYQLSYGRKTRPRRPTRGGRKHRGLDSNQRCRGFHPRALPTELPRHSGDRPSFATSPGIPPDGVEPPAGGFVDRGPSRAGDRGDMRRDYPRGIRTTISGFRARCSAVEPEGMKRSRRDLNPRSPR